MIEKDNREHYERVKEVLENEKKLRIFCQTLPKDRLLTGNDYDMDYFLEKEKSHRVYKEPTTGAKLTYKMSLMVLANFVASLPSSSESSLAPEYVMTTQNKQFICEVILPDTSPIRGAIGRPASTKQVAKCSAAFDACVALRQAKYLDENLLSTYVKQLPAMRNAHLAVNSKKQEAYAMRTKPSLWSVSDIPNELYLTVFKLANPAAIERASQPLGILTRLPLPLLPDIPLYFGHGRQSPVISTTFTKSILVDSELLTKINVFGLRIFDDVFSKEYEPDPARMPYFIVPIRPSATVDRNNEPFDLIDWNTVRHVETHKELLWDDSTPEGFFADKYIVDPFDGSRKLWTRRLAPQYKPLDPVPPNTASRAGARKNNDNIMEYSISLWAKSRSRRTFREDQPVVEAEVTSLRRNLLDDSDFAEPETSRTCFIILEPLRVSAVRQLMFDIKNMLIFIAPDYCCRHGIPFPFYHTSSGVIPHRTRSLQHASS